MVTQVGFIMHDRAARFKKVYSNTPNEIGPSTYYFTDDFGKKALVKGKY